MASAPPIVADIPEVWRYAPYRGIEADSGVDSGRKGTGQAPWLFLLSRYLSMLSFMVK